MSVNSIVLAIVVGLLKMCVGTVLDSAAVYVGQVNFDDVLANAGGIQQNNPNQLDEVFAGFVGGPSSQLSEEPVEFSDTAQAAVDNFVGLTTPDTQVNFPEFNDLLGSLSTFGFTKASMQENEEIPFKDSLADILLKQ